MQQCTDIQLEMSLKFWDEFHALQQVCSPQQQHWQVLNMKARTMHKCWMLSYNTRFCSKAQDQLLNTVC